MKIIFLISIVICSVLKVNADFFTWLHSKPIRKIDYYPLIEAFDPSGLRVSISDVDGMEQFGFQGQFNEYLVRAENGSLMEYINEPTNGRWVYVNNDVKVKYGDSLYFYFDVKLKGELHRFPVRIQNIYNLIPKPNSLYFNDCTNCIGQLRQRVEDSNNDQPVNSSSSECNSISSNNPLESEPIQQQPSEQSENAKLDEYKQKVDVLKEVDSNVL